MPIEVRSEDDLRMLDMSAVATSMPPLTTASDLYECPTKPLTAIVPSLLFTGLTMLVAKPKAGKSWFTLQLAIAIAGGPPMAGLDIDQYGSVLYVALEEPKSRTEARLRKIAAKGAWASNIHFAYSLPPLMAGGAEQLEAYIHQVRPVMVIVDTFTAAVKIGTKSGSDVFRSQYGEVSRLREIAEKNNAGMVCVHHTRKGASDGAIESVAGTGGIAAAVDAVWLLKRKLEGEATLEVVGRETEESTFALRFEQEPFGWKVLGEDAAQLINSERREVIELLKEDGPLTPAQIATALAKTHPSTRQLLRRMRTDGLLSKQGQKYVPHTL